MRTHILTLGCTGMLAGAVKELARRGCDVSLLSRRPGRLISKRMHPFPCDWQDVASVLAATSKAVDALDQPRQALVWCHDKYVAYALARALAPGGETVDYFHVLGSGVSDPARPDRLNRLNDIYKAIQGIDWHAICLGFVIEDETSRWLTHSEICHGVLKMMTNPAAQHVIGTTRPWSAKP